MAAGNPTPPIALLVLGIVAAGCAAPAPSGAGSAAETPAQLREGDHVAGTYTYRQFQPRIEVTLPDDDWTTFHLTRDFFDVGIETANGPVVVMFFNPIAFLDAEEAEAAATTPQDAIELMADHEGTSLSEPRPVEIGGRSGLEVDADFEIDNTHVMRVSDGDIGFGPTNDVRLAVLEADDGVLVIGLIAPEDQMDEAEALTQAVRDSIRIE